MPYPLNVISSRDFHTLVNRDRNGVYAHNHGGLCSFTNPKWQSRNRTISSAASDA
jgi:hypothetical protein